MRGSERKMGENSYRLILDYPPPLPHSRIPRVIFVSLFFSNETSNGENGKTIDLIFLLFFCFLVSLFSLNVDKSLMEIRQNGNTISYDSYYYFVI